jgi:hypothetical protein
LELKKDILENSRIYELRYDLEEEKLKPKDKKTC